MSNPQPPGEPEQQWQQPAFEPRDEASALPVPVPPPPAAFPVARPPVSPPSVAEAALATVSGVVWPVTILLIIFTGLPWWPAILIPIVTSVITDNVRKYLRQRRRALEGTPNPARDEDDLR